MSQYDRIHNDLMRYITQTEDVIFRRNIELVIGQQLPKKNKKAIQTILDKKITITKCNQKCTDKLPRVICGLHVNGELKRIFSIPSTSDWIKFAIGEPQMYIPDGFRI